MVSVYESSHSDYDLRKNNAVSRTRFLIPYFLLFSLFAFPSVGAVDKIVFPESMQKVDFGGCRSLTGTAELVRV